MKINTIHKMLIAIIILVGTIFTTCPVYAFALETLDKSLDFNDIKNKEGEILSIVNDFVGEENNDCIVDYSRAAKVYVDTNIFAYKSLSKGIIADLLDSAVYLWEIPVKVSDEEYVICTISKVPPMAEDTKRSLLDAKVFTEEELAEEEAKVGEWEIPTWANGKNHTDYIGNIEEVMGESFNPDDEKKLYLLGGTPNMRQPFGLIEMDGDYSILTLDPLISEEIASESDITIYGANIHNDIYSFTQVKNWINTLPPENENDGDTGYKDITKKEPISSKNSINYFIGIIPASIIILGGIIYVLYTKRKRL